MPTSSPAPVDDYIPLVDVNAFFVSADRVSDPTLHKRQGVERSSKDGCAVARSNDANALGMPRGMPWFQHEATAAPHNLVVRSGNYELSGEMSARMMGILS